MLTKEDYQNLANLVARGDYKGIGEAAAAVQLFHKLQTLAQATEEKNDGVNAPSGDKSSADGNRGSNGRGKRNRSDSATSADESAGVHQSD